MAGKFEPKEPVELDPPRNDVIPLEVLAKADGSGPDKKCYVAIKGKVYDVTGNPSYLPGKPYNVFAGRDASRALAKSSTKAEDAKPEWEDLDEKEKKTLNDWITFFSKRYNVIGTVEGTKKMENEATA